MTAWIGEPAREDIEREHPGWEVYRGVSDWWFARRRDDHDRRVHGEDLMDLRDAIRRADALNA